jgi:hypothetical protein
MKSGHSMLESVLFGVLLGIAAGFVLVRPPERSRRIPSYVRMAVIARDLKGAPFDPTIHHIDHIVPFSKGGDNSVQNLRVVPKAYNLRRGARMPGFLDLLGRKPKLQAQTARSSVGTLSGQESEPGRGRLRRLAVIVLLVAVVAFWHLVKIHRLTANSTPVTANPSLHGPAPAIAAAPPPSVPPAAATETPVPVSPSPADILDIPATVESAPAASLGAPPETPESSAVQALPGEPPTAPPDNIGPAAEPVERRGTTALTYTTGELLTLYKSDKRTADRILKGTTIKVTGTIVRVGKDELSLRERADPDSVNCKFDRRFLPQASPTARTTVTVKGRVKGRGVTGTIHLENCELVDSTTW